MSLADLKAFSNITAEELADLRRICFGKCEEVNGHLFFKGVDTKKYAQTNFQFRNTRFHMKKAQLSYFLKIKEQESFDMETWGEDKCVSHLCHQKSCIKPEHLTLENNEQNRERDDCVRRGHCVGHQDQPNCLI